MRLSRRSLLASKGGLAVLGRDAASQQKAPTASLDAVGVSAGLSGLIAARELLKKAKTAAVLEAKGRIGGGRMINQKVAGDGVIDLGGQWGGEPITSSKLFRMS